MLVQVTIKIIISTLTKRTRSENYCFSILAVKSQETRSDVYKSYSGNMLKLF